MKLIEVKNPLKTGHAGNIEIIHKGLTTLEDTYVPNHIIGNFTCAGNKLTNLKGGPEAVEGNYNCRNNSLLESLEGAPKFLLGEFNFSICGKLRSLKYAPSCEGLIFMNTPIDFRTIKGMNIKIKEQIYFTPTETTNLLYLLLCPGIRQCSTAPANNSVVGDILNKHLQNEIHHRDLHMCQQELIDAGYADIARI